MPILNMTRDLLEKIKEHYRNHVTAMLMLEEDDKGSSPQKKKPATAEARSEIDNGSGEEPDDESTTQDYLKHDWEEVRGTEYYKYFFIGSKLDDILTLSTNSVFDKSAKKKRKKKKPSEHKKEPQKQEDTKELPQPEIRNAETAAPSPLKEPAQKPPPIPIPEPVSAPVQDVSAVTSVEKKPEVPEPEKREVAPQPKTAGSRKRGGKKKSVAAATVSSKNEESAEQDTTATATQGLQLLPLPQRSPEAKAEYEAIRKSALKMFAEKTGVAVADGKKKKKKHKKKPAAAETPAPVKPTEKEGSVASSRKDSTSSCKADQSECVEKVPAETWTRKHSEDSSGFRPVARYHESAPVPVVRYRKKKEEIAPAAAAAAAATHSQVSQPAPGPRPAYPYAYPYHGKTEEPAQPMFVYESFYLDQKQEPLIAELNQEITTLLTKMDEYNLSLKHACEVVRRNIEEQARKALEPSSGLKAVVYGSAATGLALRTSDIDVAVTGLPISGMENCVDALYKLSEHLAGVGYVTSCKVIPAARVPVIKLVSRSLSYANPLIDGESRKDGGSATTTAQRKPRDEGGCDDRWHDAGERNVAGQERDHVHRLGAQQGGLHAVVQTSHPPAKAAARPEWAKRSLLR